MPDNIIYLHYVSIVTAQPFTTETRNIITEISSLDESFEESSSSIICRWESRAERGWRLVDFVFLNRSIIFDFISCALIVAASRVG